MIDKNFFKNSPLKEHYNVINIKYQTNVVKLNKKVRTKKWL